LRKKIQNVLDLEGAHLLSRVYEIPCKIVQRIEFDIVMRGDSTQVVSRKVSLVFGYRDECGFRQLLNCVLDQLTQEVINMLAAFACNLVEVWILNNPTIEEAPSHPFNSFLDILDCP